MAAINKFESMDERRLLSKELELSFEEFTVLKSTQKYKEHN